MHQGTACYCHALDKTPSLAVSMQKKRGMIFKFFFKNFTESKKLDYTKENGTLLGTRTKSDRTVFLYMVKDFFVEILYKNDDSDEGAESINTFSSLDRLNSYLEREFRTAF